MMRKTILLLALVALSFCAETATERYDDALYMIYAGGFDYLNVYPYMEFTAALRLSVDDPSIRVVYAGDGGSRSDLQEGAIVCEGPITAQFTPTGIWARDGNLEQTLNYYQRDPPSYSGGVSADRPIFWSSSVYDAFYAQESCTEDESCWGRLSGLVLQPADFVRTGEWFYERESRTNVVCKGTISLREGSTLLSSGVIEGTPVTNTNTYLRGTHTFTGQMDITGCAAVVRHPEFPEPYVSREEIYSRTEARPGTSAPQYSGVAGPVSISLRSVTNEDLRCSGDFVSITPSPISAEPGATTPITITIRNNCPASDPLCQPITVGTVSVSDGFSFRLSTPGLTPMSYFVINPGQSKEFSGMLTVPNDEAVCTTMNRPVTFNVSFACPACSPAGGTIPGHATYTVRFECPPGNTTDLVPRFEPDLSRFDIPTGERPNITIITRNNGDGPSNPGETCVQAGYYMAGSVGPFGPPIRLFVPLSPEYRYSYPALSPGEEYGDALDFLCTEEMENNTYVVLVDVDCPGLGTTNEGEFENNNHAERYVRCVPPAGGNETGGEHYGCAVEPGSYQGIPGETYGFSLVCRDNVLGIEGECDFADGVDWSYRATGNASVSEHGIGNLAGYWVTLDPRSRGEGNVRITADVEFEDGNATCSADINVPQVPCEDFV